MRLIRYSSLLVISSLVACSTAKRPEVTSHYSKQEIGRKIASLGGGKELKKKIETLLDGIFHSYLLGHVYLQDFDNQLDTDPENAMRSESYSTLLAIRTHVDQFEHDLNDLYIDLVSISAHPASGPGQKLNAEFALNTIGEFLSGIKTNKEKLPDNLKPLILANLREKQTHLYDELKKLQKDPAFDGDEEAKAVIHKNMVLLRATRKSYLKEIMNYSVDQDVFEQTLAEEKKKAGFKELQKNIIELSMDMRSLIKELGRGTSSDEIAPSAGPNGNISGRSFPPRTWSLTYDDGPGRTTDQIITNLLERKIPATFFVLAKQVEGNPKTSKRIKDSGLELASHSYTHAQLTKVGSDQLEREIGASKKLIEAKLGTPITLFRLPYGAGVSVSRIRAKIAEHKMVHVFWNVDTLDWQDKNPQTIFARSVKQMKASSKNAGIVLFHDIHPQSVVASTLLMDYMNKENLNVCSVQKVVDQMNKDLPSCK